MNTEPAMGQQPWTLFLPAHKCQKSLSHNGCSHKFHFKPTIHKGRNTPGKCCMSKYVWQTPTEQVCLCAHVLLCFWLKHLCTGKRAHTHFDLWRPASGWQWVLKVGDRTGNAQNGRKSFWSKRKEEVEVSKFSVLIKCRYILFPFSPGASAVSCTSWLMTFSLTKLVSLDTSFFVDVQRCFTILKSSCM